MGHKIIFLFIPFILLACEKPNPQPEKLDPIYSEIEKEIKSTEADIVGMAKMHEDYQKALEAVVPQTGQIKYATKRVRDSAAALEKLKQRKLYWEIRLKSRLAWAREKYMEAYLKKQPWPPPEEFAAYKAQRNLESAPKNWSNKDRIEMAQPKKGRSSTEAGAGGSGKPPEKH